MRRPNIAPPELQSNHFEFNEKNLEKAKSIIAKYPKGKQASAVIPLLDLAQRQHNNWLPTVAMDYVADLLDMPAIKVYEVASFYTMFNRKPVGKHFIQVCRTTSCWLRGSDELVKTCERKLNIKPGEMTPDGKFSLVEVECLGAFVNAPMVQINDDYYEDLDVKNFEHLLGELASAQKVTIGSQTGREASCPIDGPTTLKKYAKKTKGDI